MATDEITLQTSRGRIDVYIDPSGWARLFLEGAEGRAVKEVQDLLDDTVGVIKCLQELGVPLEEAQALAAALVDRLPEHPSVKARLLRLASKAAEIIDKLPDLPNV
jgi:hypothetical protein